MIDATHPNLISPSTTKYQARMDKPDLPINMSILTSITCRKVRRQGTKYLDIVYYNYVRMALRGSKGLV